MICKDVKEPVSLTTPWPGQHVQRFLYVVFVHDDGRKGGAPKGATGGVWRQWSAGFYPRLPDVMLQAAQVAVERYGTQAKVLEVDFETGRVETIEVLDHGTT